MALTHDTPLSGSAWNGNFPGEPSGLPTRDELYATRGSELFGGDRHFGQASQAPAYRAAALERQRSLLQEAIDKVYGDREADYGHPIHNHTTTAALWAAFLNGVTAASGAPDVVLAPEHVALMQILAKVGRQVHRPKHDNLVDIAGYAQAVERIYQFQADAVEEQG